MPTQSAVSYFADQFSKKTNKDLLTYVTDMLNDNEKLKLITIIESKPLGIVDAKTNKLIK